MKKVLVFGGGTGLSNLLKGLKQFPIDITAVVSVCDDGRSTGRLRKEFNVPAVGDIRQVIVALSETEPLIEKMLNYRFKTTSDLNGHALGNLLLTSLIDISGDFSTGIQSLSKVLNLKGKVLPLTNDNVTLEALMKDGNVIVGENEITEYNGKIDKIYYKNNPKVLTSILDEIKKTDLIIFSMGSLFTSLLPNLICPEIIKAIDESTTKIMYICNLFTQAGETDNYTVNDHINEINKYLNKRKVDCVIANNGNITKEMINKYQKEENKSPVILDKIDKNIQLITDNYVKIVDNTIKHDSLKLGFSIFSYLMK